MATTVADPTVILSIARTPMGAMQGALSDASATDLGATAVKAAVERAGVSGDSGWWTAESLSIEPFERSR